MGNQTIKPVGHAIKTVAHDLHDTGPRQARRAEQHSGGPCIRTGHDIDANLHDAIDGGQNLAEIKCYRDYFGGDFVGNFHKAVASV